MLTPNEQHILAQEISPVMGEIFFVVVSGLLGLLVVLTCALQKKTFCQALPVAIGAASIIAPIFALLHSTHIIPGLFAAVMGGLLSAFIWAGCILVYKYRKEAGISRQ